MELKQALAPYLIGGPWGRLLDAEQERLGEAAVQAFETEGLIGVSSAAAVLAYLFHRIEGRLDGSPTMIIIDEGWLVLDRPAFAAQLRASLEQAMQDGAVEIVEAEHLSRSRRVLAWLCYGLVRFAAGIAGFGKDF